MVSTETNKNTNQINEKRPKDTWARCKERYREAGARKRRVPLGNWFLLAFRLTDRSGAAFAICAASDGAYDECWLSSSSLFRCRPLGTGSLICGYGFSLHIQLGVGICIWVSVSVSRRLWHWIAIPLSLIVVVVYRLLFFFWFFVSFFFFLFYFTRTDTKGGPEARGRPFLRLGFTYFPSLCTPAHNIQVTPCSAILPTIRGSFSRFITLKSRSLL